MTEARSAPASASDDLNLGQYLRDRREVLGLTLRQVEDRTKGRVKNGYLSQVEGGHIIKPSPEILWQLSGVYGDSYANLLTRAGHRVPVESAPDLRRSINGVPLSAIASLTPDERDELVRYIGFLRHRLRSAPDGA